MTEEALHNLRRSILEFNKDLGITAAQEIVDEGSDILGAMDMLTAAMREIGEGFERNELWLPDLMAGASTMSAIMPIIEEKLKEEKKDRHSHGVVVIGTVRGDIHDIGKYMVATLLIADNFTVYDLGVDLPPERFLEGVQEHEADILAMSALLITTAPEMRSAIAALKEQDLGEKVKGMIGGGPIMEVFPWEVGADGHYPTAPGAVKLARQLMET
ncbi:MAG: cobalamin-dependent protein [Anaerolineales bacterium]|nr:cobalamin-dependent protein [Anaerolineales bacterium]